MGSITSGIGLVSGIDSGSIIDALLAIESRPKIFLQTQVARLQQEQAAFLDINSRLLNFMTAADAFRKDAVFSSALATSSNEDVLTANASIGAPPGSYKFIVRQLVGTSQLLSRGFADAGSTPVGLSTLSFELGRGSVAPDTELANLNGGSGVDRGRIKITDRAGTAATIDLTDVTTLDEVLERVNDNGTAQVTASIEADHLVITDTSGGAGNLIVADLAGDTAATDLGIAGSVAASTLTGTDINFVGSTTTLDSLNDGNGVLVKENVTDFTINASSGVKFDIDLGRIDVDITGASLVADLNNGAGIPTGTGPDIKLVDTDGNDHTVDFSGATTVQDLIDRVDTQTSSRFELSIVNGQQFQIRDTAGDGPEDLKILGSDENGTDTAEALGILNVDGVDSDLHLGTLVPYLVDQGTALTIQDVIDRINDAKDELGADNAGRIVASLSIDGTGITIDDTTGATMTIVEAAANGNAAAQLGILETAGTATRVGDRLIAGLGSVLVRNLNGGAGITVVAAGSPQTLSGATLLSELFNGEGVTTNGDPFDIDIEVEDRNAVTYEIEVDGLTSVQDFIDAFNTATGGNVTIAIEGQAFRVTDHTGGVNDLTISNQNGASVASELGIEIDDAVDTVLGVDTQPIYSADGARILITNRNGDSTALDVATDRSLRDIIDRINAAGAGVVASVNANGNGLQITDTSGGTGNLTISGNAAADLGIDADVAADSIQGRNLQHQYVSVSSKLDDLNYGRGIGTGSFRIRDASGATADVSIGGTETTLDDIIDEINSKGLDLLARVNDTGDGLLIESTLTAEASSVTLRVTSLSGSTAADLNILGESATVADAEIDGSYERSVSISAGDTLDAIVQKINDAGIPVSATVINTGSGPTPHRLSLTSGVSGRLGSLVVDSGSFDLGLTTLSKGQDAKVFFGADDPADGFFFTSPTNSLSGVVPGLTVDFHDTSDKAVTVTVSRDEATIVEAVRSFVTGFNDVIGVIDQYDFFDVENETRGVLLGNGTTQGVRANLLRTVQTGAVGVGSFRFLSQVGIRINSDSQLELDDQKLKAAYAADPVAVEGLFAAFESTTNNAVQEIAPGVTINESSETVTSQGFGQIFASLTDRLTNALDGTVTQARDGLGNRIELLESRIEDMDVRLAARRARLQRQFAAMELALANLQSQSNALLSLNSNLALSQSGLNARRSG